MLKDPYYVDLEKQRKARLLQYIRESKRKENAQYFKNSVSDPVTPIKIENNPSIPTVEKTWDELTVVCWKWKQKNYRSKFTARHVNVLQNQIARNLTIPHRFVCITDDARGVKCETIKLWDEPKVNLSEERPNCYRRLKAFASDAEEWLGKRIVSIDLDTVITGDITPIVDQPYDFMIWGDTARNTKFNGGFWVLTAGTRTQVWDTFTPDANRITGDQGIIGSDQAWISYVLGDEYVFSVDDGVYSYRNHLENGAKDLPENARIVFFHGKYDPWDEQVQKKSPWIQQYYY